MAWYKRGTITLTQGSAAVTGTDAMFTAGIMEGSGIVVAGQYLAGVLSVEDNDHLTLSKPWPHATMTAVAYEAYPTESRAARQLDLTAELIDAFAPLRGSAQDFKDKITDRADEVAANQADVAAKLTQTIAARDAALTAETNAETAQAASEAARDVAITKRDEAVAARDASITAKTASETARDASITAKTASETAKTASETARDASIAAKTASETAKTAAETARNASQTAQAASELARDGSVTAKTASEAARDVASTKRDEAVAAKTASEAARDVASTKRDEAGTFRNQAEAEKLAAQTARTGAETAEDNAALSAADAAQSATDAQTAQTGAEAARDVSVSAKTASEGARDASVAAKVASEGARDTAITNRNEAISAKTAAETARDVAISNRNDAVSAAVDAAGSAGDAAGSASSAADSAAAAAASALEASQFDATLYPKLAQDNVFSGSMTVPYLTVAAGAGSEGGEVKLKKGSGQGLDGDLIVDTAGDSFRVFDQTTPTRMLDYNLVAGHLSINGQSVYHTGNKPSKADVGLGSVSNLAPADMPISTATQNALNGKQATIAAGTTAQYWRGDKTWQTLNKAAVGLGNVDNTSDASKPVSSAQQSALDGKLSLSGGQMTGRLNLSASGLRIATMDDIATRTESGFFNTGSASVAEGWPATTGGWYHLISATHENEANYYSMQFAGQFDNQNEVYYRSTGGDGSKAWNKLYHSGNLSKATLGLGNVDNTSDASKPVSTAQQTALNAKANASVTLTAGNGLTGGGAISGNVTFTLGTPGTLTGSTTNSVTATSHTHDISLTKADVGLGSVDNTSDAAKPVSTATQNALNNKVDKLSGNRPGIYKIYRRENDSGYSVQTHWTGSYWQLRGYDGADAFHAECYVERAGSAGWADRAYPRRVGNVDLNFNWSGQGGQPTWVWGGSDGSNMYVYNPSNFSVNYANGAGNSDTVDGVHGWQLAPKSAFLCAGVATYAAGVITRRSDKNVSSITRLGLGRFQVNVANALPGYYVVMAKGDESVLQMSAQSYNRGTASFALAFTHISDTPDPADPPIFDFVVLDAGLLA